MDSRGIFKGVDVDLRQYKKLKMYLHAESIQGKLPYQVREPQMNMTEDWSLLLDWEQTIKIIIIKLKFH